MPSGRPVSLKYIRGNVEGETFLSEEVAMEPSEEWRIDMIDRAVFHSPSRILEGGKWVLKAPEDDINEVWDQVNRFMDQGCFGYAKCSTKAGSENYDSHMICVYNNDIADTDYIESMGELLSTADNIEEIGYKPNASTALGIYGENEYVYTMK